MKKIFTIELFAQLLIQVILLGIVVFFIQKYIENKWGPMTAAETLKKENFLNAKRDTYFEAINILNRTLAHSDFTIDGVPMDTTNIKRGGTYPTSLEVNSCNSKLWIYSDNNKIPMTYYKLFDTNDKKMKPVLEMRRFVNLLRNDMGYGDIKIDTTKDQYKFITIHRRGDK